MSSPRVYLDSNVFINAYETKLSQGHHAWLILTAIEDGELIGVTSELTLAEVLVKPIEQRNYELAEHYQEIIAPAGGFEVSAINRSILIEAASLRAVSKGLRLPDAIHVATARLNACTHFLSDDRRLSAAPGLAIVQLGAYALEAIRGPAQ
jgi:predicted nucleic acid-binding protein